MSIEIELCLISANKEVMRKIRSQLPIAIEIEDRIDGGWGVVLRPTDTFIEGISDAELVSKFMSELLGISDLLVDGDPLLRIGNYFETATFTQRIPNSELFRKVPLSIEVSGYPVSD